VTEAGQLWLKSREAAGIERSTLDRYRQHLDLHITPLIGATKLSALTVPFVRTFEDRLRQELSAAMVKKVLASLSSILSDAQDRGLVAQNVAHQRRVRNKGNANTRQKRLLEVGRDIPTPAEIRTIIANLNGDGRGRPFLLTAIFTGLRASELRGLRWNDIDLSRNELHVRQRADRYHTLGAPKSATSQRSIPLLPMVVNALREWRLACPHTESGLVFPGSPVTRPITLATVIEMNWHPAQIAAGVVTKDGSAKYSGLHALRHFFASWCINRSKDGGLELPIKVVQARMGHSSIQITADRYGHLFPRRELKPSLARQARARACIDGGS
jgi:integrase